MTDFLFQVFLWLGIIYLATELYYNISNIIYERRVENAIKRNHPDVKDAHCSVDRHWRRRDVD